jgi:hypothetical protein
VGYRIPPMAGEGRPRAAHHCDSSAAPSDLAAALFFNIGVLAGLSMVLPEILTKRCAENATPEPQRRDGASRRGCKLDLGG